MGLFRNKYRWLAVASMLAAIAWFVAGAWHMQEMMTAWRGEPLVVTMTSKGEPSRGPWSNGRYYHFSDGYLEFDATVTSDRHFDDTVQTGWQTTFLCLRNSMHIFIHTSRSKWSFAGMFAADIIMMLLFFRITIDMIKRGRAA